MPTKGRPIVTLADARKYLLAIPEAEHTAAVETATEAVTMAAEGRGPLLRAQVGMTQLIYGPSSTSEPLGKLSWRGTGSR